MSMNKGEIGLTLAGVESLFSSVLDSRIRNCLEGLRTEDTPATFVRRDVSGEGLGLATRGVGVRRSAPTPVETRTLGSARLYMAPRSDGTYHVLLMTSRLDWASRQCLLLVRGASLAGTWRDCGGGHLRLEFVVDQELGGLLTDASNDEFSLAVT